MVIVLSMLANNSGFLQGTRQAAYPKARIAKPLHSPLSTPLVIKAHPDARSVSHSERGCLSEEWLRDMTWKGKKIVELLEFNPIAVSSNGGRT